MPFETPISAQEPTSEQPSVVENIHPDANPEGQYRIASNGESRTTEDGEIVALE